jgi:hypothetical protein
MWPEDESLVFLIALLLYAVGAGLMNVMLTSEFFRKNQLEADQVAARQIQQTLTPAKVDEVPGYEVETFYKPLLEVGGDYFDIIELGGSERSSRLRMSPEKGCRRRCWQRIYKLWLEAARVLRRIRWPWPGRLTGTSAAIPRATALRPRSSLC